MAQGESVIITITIIININITIGMKVSKEVGGIREEEHRRNIEHYDTVVEKRETYAVPKLTEQEKSILKKHFEQSQKK